MIKSNNDIIEFANSKEYYEIMSVCSKDIVYKFSKDDIGKEFYIFSSKYNILNKVTLTDYHFHEQDYKVSGWDVSYHYFEITQGDGSSIHWQTNERVTHELYSLNVIKTIEQYITDIQNKIRYIDLPSTNGRLLLNKLPDYKFTKRIVKHNGEDWENILSCYTRDKMLVISITSCPVKTPGILKYGNIAEIHYLYVNDNTIKRHNGAFNVPEPYKFISDETKTVSLEYVIKEFENIKKIFTDTNDIKFLEKIKGK